VLEVISSSKVGQVSVIHATSTADAFKLRSVATSTASKLWGRKSYISALHADRVEIFRIN